MANAVGLDLEKLPPLAESIHILGGVNNQDFIKLGIRPYTPVCCGSGDTVASLLALGLDSSGAMLSLGTSFAAYVVTNSNRFDPMLMARSYIFKGKWAVGGAMSNPGAMLRWYRDTFCSDLVEKAKHHGVNVYTLIDSEAKGCEPGSGGVLCLPYINGERSPVYDSGARAVILGLNLHSNRAALARSIMEGSAFGMRQILELMEQVSGIEIDTVTVTGGGSKSNLLVQIMADVTGHNMCVSEEPNVGAIGACLLGAMSIGENPLTHLMSAKRTFVPNESLRKLYDDAYTKYIQIYNSTRHLI